MKLYKLVTELGQYYVVATDMTAAEQKLMEVLNHGDGYGFSRERKVTHCNLIAEAVTRNVGAKADYNLTGKFLIL